MTPPITRTPPEAFDLTWVGHATVLVAAGGLRILTDPLITERVAHLRRRVAAPAQLAPEVVLISHAHADHLHLPSLRPVAAGAQVIAPRGTAGLLGRLPIGDLREVSPGDTVTIGAVTLEVTPAAHSCRRGPHSRVRAEPVGYVVRAAGRSAYFAGDTDLFPAMRELADIDVALLPIWGWGPTLGEGHLDPHRAAEATAWISPGRVVPIHWGTYSPIRPRPGAPAWLDTPLDTFRRALTERDLADRLRVLAPGSTLHAAQAGAAS